MSTSIGSSFVLPSRDSSGYQHPGPLPTPPPLHDQTTSAAPEAEPSVVRRPTLHLPTLHLGSFDTLSISGTAPLPQSRHFSQTSSHSSSNSLLREESVGKDRAEEAGSGKFSRKQQLDGTSQLLGVEPTRSPSHSSGSSSHRLHKAYNIPPPLPPPTMALPPLPNLSPISPIKPPSPSYLQSTMFQPQSSSSSSSSVGQQLPGESRRELPTVPARNRLLGHSLSIHVPGPLTPSPSDQEGNRIPSPILKHSPGVARRRTVVESTNTDLGSPVRVSGFTGNMSPPRDLDSSPTRNSDHKSPPIERGSILMPQPRPSPGVEQKASFETTPRRLEKKRSSADLKNTSPTSPTAKRSLPRPPRIDTSLPTQPSVSDLTARLPQSTSLSQTALPSNIATAPHSQAEQQQNVLESQHAPIPVNAQSSLALPVTAPVPSSSWPPLNVNRSPTTAKASPLQTQTKQTPKPTIYQKHQANKSASSLPVVAGLADAGPFAGAFARPIQTGGVIAGNGLGLGRPSNQIINGQARGPSGKPQEEVCLECMMRDRDLADVVVQGEGVWERESDGDWKDLEWREEAILKSMGAQEDDATYKELFRAADESSEDSDSTSFSPPSTGNSAEEAQLRKDLDARRKRRSLLKAKKREADRRISKEVGWRGHKWEEGDSGEGLPRGFRGTKGGKLTEAGIKGVMTKFPSASAHRYQTLQGYLRQQWHLVQEVRAEAQRLGRFPFPDEVVNSSSTFSSHEGPSAPRGIQATALYQREQYGRDGVYTPVRSTPTLSVVRPSPSTPANLTGLANPPRAAPLQRPLTHFLPDREPSLGAPRTPIYASPIAVSTRSRHGKQGSSPGLLERSPAPGTCDESNEELWSPGDEPGAGLRPFSFAVRAGATAGSDGHGGRKSLWGRFGGSVTSLFGGSQNGSGSMMDMHLGLDSDRRSRTSSYNVAPHPRAVSMASPTRPSFFSRDSRCSSDINVSEMPRVSRAISHSRLSQMRLDDDDEDDDEADERPKRKGIKGFFKKMKPKSSKSKSRSQGTAGTEGQYRTERNEQPQPDTPLAPPPPISYLVGGNRKHARNRSGSSSSMLTDDQDSTSGNKRYSANLPYGMRSVSAPMNGAASSSGGSLSASPTNSKFATSGPGKRESYASGRRRTSFGVNEMGEQQQFGPTDQDRRHSGMEMLNNNLNKGIGIYSTSPDMIYDEPSSMYRSNNMGYPNANLGSAGSRPHNKTTSSLSNSSGTMAIETPPPAIFNSSAFFNQQSTQQPNVAMNEKAGSMTRSPSGPISPNRFKNLPPLPPQDNAGNKKSMTASPDSFVAAFPDQEVTLTGNHDPKYLSSFGYPTPQSSAKIDFSASTPIGSPNSIRFNQQQYNHVGYPQPQLHVNTQNLNQQFGSAHARAMANGRASFDQPSPRARVGGGNERAVKTMYGQPMMEDLRPAHDYGNVINETKKKKGLKGFFGSNKAGRIA
ncbi:uncharacterized protein I206_105283 [Kwoniella pini CBS 10737]|uniref:Uncharacterized protein n=1 Tax=Kwoniella pini CBS 10737 TaxID=1296096 RepID=A0A1B9I4Q4_9TREE|nr:uncharacterized protein I206_03808 [Kwoniella pini CBS 10737]OCF50484.1 hypothetical protein I206_03808 [Kwoniella pini CBS 10737]